MRQSKIIQKISRFVERARLERLQSPEMIQEMKAVRHDRPRIAYCKNDAGAATTITCYLDTDATGTEITVTCSIAQGGTSLNAAVPRLADGDWIMVSKVGTTWRCLTTFQPSEDCACS